MSSHVLSILRVSKLTMNEARGEQKSNRKYAVLFSYSFFSLSSFSISSDSLFAVRGLTFSFFCVIHYMVPNGSFVDCRNVRYFK